MSVSLLVCYFLTEIIQIWGYLHFWMRYLSEIFLRHSWDIGSLFFTLLGRACILTFEFLCPGLIFETSDLVTIWFSGGQLLRPLVLFFRNQLNISIKSRVVTHPPTHPSQKQRKMRYVSTVNSLGQTPRHIYIWNQQNISVHSRVVPTTHLPTHHPCLQKCIQTITHTIRDPHRVVLIQEIAFDSCFRQQAFILSCQSVCNLTSLSNLRDFHVYICVFVLVQV